MTTSEVIIQMLSSNYGVIQMQVNGLTHEQSLLQLPFRGNCLNWVIGHILEHRDKMLKALNLEPLLTEAEAALYKTNSEPITSSETALPFEKLLADLGTAHERLITALKAISQAELDTVPPGEERTLGKRLFGLSWHETYHTGHTDILRQLAGTNDKVI